MIHLFMTVLIWLSMAQGQTLEQQGDLFEMSFSSSNPTEAHNSANRFASLIGDELKQRFPSKILDPDVELRIYMQNGQKLYRLTWYCRIVPASIGDADYYFDRRGSMLAGATINEARQKVQDEIMTSKKVLSMRKSFPKGEIPFSFVRESFSGSSTEQYWLIREYFLTAPK